MRSRPLLSALLACAALSGLSVTARAQEPERGDSARPAVARTDSLFAHAARMVREGRGDAGRAIVDSLLAAADTGSPAFAEALYWQSALAAAASDAERGYRRLVVEYPTSRRTGDALFNLAQLELARGSRAQALQHLERLEREQPAGMLRARAALLAARLHTEARDPVKACAALASARASLPETAVELRNQLEFQAASCARGGTPAPIPVTKSEVATAPAPATTAAPAPAPASSPASSAARTPATAVTGGYSVQMAALETRGEAERMAARLVDAGIPARVTGTEKPFRVRVGRYATRAEASRALESLRSRSRDAFVVPAEAAAR